ADGRWPFLSRPLAAALGSHRDRVADDEHSRQPGNVLDRSKGRIFRFLFGSSLRLGLLSVRGGCDCQHGKEGENELASKWHGYLREVGRRRVIIARRHLRRNLAAWSGRQTRMSAPL